MAAKDNNTSPSPLPAVHDALALRQLDVRLGDSLVGTLALTDEGIVAFAYSDQWLREGFSLNPFSLPLEKRVFLPKRYPLDGLFGVFDDSLPDGWGRLLVDRFLREHGIDPFEVSPLARLAIVGASGMGALEYLPHFPLPSPLAEQSLDELAEACAAMLATDYSDDIDTLFALAGSSGGARPKIFTAIDGEPWIVKFPSSVDPPSIGAQEFSIAQTAAEAGIIMPEVRLLESRQCEGYFAIKRFDRVQTPEGTVEKRPMVSAGALLETSHRIPNLDYDLLMKLTLRLTESMKQVEALFRLMAFNVFIGNRDDHAKNFSFVRQPVADASWELAPGYDLTANYGMNGEHATTVNGKGREITVADIVDVGVRVGLRHARATAIVDQIREVAHERLGRVIDLPHVPLI